MKFGVPWGVKEIRPEARETAKEAARRSGMSLGDWLDSVILRQAQQDGIGLRPPSAQPPHGDGTADVHQRLDELTRRIEQLTRKGPAAYAPRRRNNDARLLSSPPLAPAMSPPSMPSMQLPPGLDYAIAEVSARRRALNGEPPPPLPAALPQAPQMPPAAPAPMAAPARPAPMAPMQSPLPTQNLAGLEDQLRRITDQIETLRKPGVEEAISALRKELGEIGRTLADAMPRNAIDAIEKQILEVATRIDDGRQAGVDQQALAGIERGLAEVRDALHGLTPAENLVGFNEAVASLAHKIDLIIAQKDPATLDQLESAITTLRSMAERVASNEAVTQLSNEVLVLGEKIDYIAHAAAGSEALNNLDHRVAAIADALAERTQSGGTVPAQLESLVRSLSDKIERVQLSGGDNVAISHLEDRIVTLVEKLDASQSRLGQLETIERGLNDLLVHMEDMRASKSAEPPRTDNAPAVFELKQNMVHTQDALEAVHDTLGHVVDRLAGIEKEFRGNNRRPTDGAAEATPMPPVGKLAVRAVNSAAPQPTPPTIQIQAPATPPKAAPEPPPPPAPPPKVEAKTEAAPQPQAAPPRRVASSLPINLDPTADQPIEPGSGPPRFSARIAASEAALGGVGPAEAAPGGKSNFIAAARRAAQAAMQQGTRAPAPQADSVLELEEGRPPLRAKVMKRMRSVFIAASIIAIVVGGFQIAGNWLNLADTPKNGIDKSGKTEPSEGMEPGVPPGKNLGRSDASSDSAPVTSPAKPVEIQPLSGLNGTAPAQPSLFNPPILSPPPPASPASNPSPAETKNNVTGSIPDNTHRHPESSGETAVQKNERLPAGIGSTRLRNAAIAGDVGAAYEVALRFADGRGVPASLADAAYWYGRAASRGLAPAQFRYASMLEKGQGVKKDQGRARELYLAAAAKGNAKAMHNLAVLYAEGVDGKPDYSAAVKWFRLAAKHGVADSQYNLGVLTARGFGTEKDFAASYKWFALAAAQGDHESTRKRDEVASHLDEPTLAAARQAVAAFTVEPQPKTATAVPKPQGGWDQADATPPTAGKGKTDARPPSPPEAPLSLGSFSLGKR
jgi:localization factor PodJL